MISEAVRTAMAQPPNPGTVGRMEMLAHWEAMTPIELCALLLAARRINKDPSASPQREP